MVLLIIFEVKNEKRRETLIEAVAHYGDCLRLTEGGYAVKTNDTAAAVYDALHLYLSSEDQLLVLPFAEPYTGGDARVERWLDESLR